MDPRRHGRKRRCGPAPFFSVYGYDTGKADDDRLNMEVDPEVFGAITALKRAAWVAAGDWNRTPEMILESGATEA
eukprot:6248981-Heterocapsa_arctica.AAC.1